jgi:hypothetical protein
MYQPHQQRPRSVSLSPETKQLIAALRAPKLIVERPWQLAALLAGMRKRCAGCICMSGWPRLVEA